MLVVGATKMTTLVRLSALCGCGGRVSLTGIVCLWTIIDGSHVGVFVLMFFVGATRMISHVRLSSLCRGGVRVLLTCTKTLGNG